MIIVATGCGAGGPADLPPQPATASKSSAAAHEASCGQGVAGMAEECDAGAHSVDALVSRQRMAGRCVECGNVSITRHADTHQRLPQALARACDRRVQEKSL